MEKSLRIPAIFANLTLVAGIALAWIFLAPTKIGGKASYVMIQGHSMEPKFHAGDLALIRKARSYQVGDIVTYWNDSMSAYTIHRIIDIKQDRFVLKGDNNSWIDPVYPDQEDIIGKLWFHLPKLGKAMEWLRTPVNFALVLGLAGGLLMTGMSLNPKKNKRRAGAKQISNGPLVIGLYLLGMLFFAFMALSFYAYSRPALIESNDILYRQTGKFSYTATATPGIYDTNTVQPGEPIFSELTCSLNVSFSYNLIGEGVQGLTGSQGFQARVLDVGSGWSRTVPMGPVMAFNGSSSSNSGTIDLCQVQALVANLERETGFRSSKYALEIVSKVTVTGYVGGTAIDDTFAPILPFKFDEAHFYLDPPDSVEELLNVSEPMLSEVSTLQPNVLPLFGLNPTVRTTRMVAAVGMVISSLGLLALGIYTYRTVQGNPELLIRLKYGALLLDVYEGAYEPPPPVIDVTSIDHLARLAERHGTMILHISRDYLQDYLVQAERVTYRYSLSIGNRRTPAPASFPPDAYPLMEQTNQPVTMAERAHAQDLTYRGTGQTPYELEDTQPTPAAQRDVRPASYPHELEHSEPDRSIFLEKIKF